MTGGGPYRAALSLHPVAAAATGEVVGDVLESVGPGPDVAILAVGGAHRRSMESVADTVRSTLGPATLVTVATDGFSVGGRGVGGDPAIGLWVGWCPRATAVALTVPDEPGGAVGGVDELPDDGTVVLVGTGDRRVATVLDVLAQRRPGLTVAGGLLPPGDGVMLDAWRPPASQDALVGWVMAPAPVAVAHACQAVGAAMVVTSARGAVVEELAGTPALDQVDLLLGGLSGTERDVVRHGLMVGIAVDQSGLEVDADQVVVRTVLGAVRDTRAIAVDDPITVGSLVRFMVADPGGAPARLLRGLSGLGDGAAVVFSCASRSAEPFRTDDAALVADALGPAAVLGLRCAGEIGPVGGRSWLHGYTAVTVACR